MNNNQLMTLLIAFVLGYFVHQMMRNMCGGRLVEGFDDNPSILSINPGMTAEVSSKSCNNAESFHKDKSMICDTPSSVYINNPYAWNPTAFFKKLNIEITLQPEKDLMISCMDGTTEHDVIIKDQKTGWFYLDCPMP